MGISLGRLGLVVAVILLLATPAALAADEELARDNGKREGKKSSAGTGHVVSFEAPKGAWYVRTVRIHGMRYGSGYDAKETMFSVSICDDRLVPISSANVPYSHFPPGAWKWVDVDLPRAVRVRGTFTVVAAFDPTQTKGVYVGWTETTDSHSAYGLPGGTSEPLEDEEWMIRATLCKKPPRKTPKEMVVTFDSGEQAGYKSISGGGHVLDVTKPSGKWWIQSVLLHGKRYGRNYSLRTTMFKVSVANTKMEEVAGTSARYGVFEDDWSWVEIPLEEPVEAPRKFRIVVDFDPTRTRGVYMAYTKAPRTNSFTGRIGRRATAFSDGAWMIRVRLVSEKPEAPTPMKLVSDPEVYEEDFDFIRCTVRDQFPAFEKKGIDWEAVSKVWRERFESAADDETHIRNAHQFLALLGDMHTGITESEIPVHVPGFDGLYGAGMWIAREGDHLVLRSLMAGHSLETEIRPGALLLAVDGTPAPILHEGVRRKLKTWYGWSSDHFLDARLSFQFFPFGEKKTLLARFLNPDGTIANVDLKPWGPGGKGLSRARRTLPPDVELKGPVVSARLTDDIGYIRILGGMRRETAEAFSDHLSKLKGVNAIILDCRGMGGGGDGPAWEMAGRFFTHNIRLKHDPVLKPTGKWQFEGTLVMLQDEREVSSAETFTWALAETKRAITVGRPTGGATIIPRTFEVPSGMFSFRLGCRDRPSSVAGVQPEGIGTRPDVYVSYNAAILEAHHDPMLAVAQDIARCVLLGASRSTVVKVYGGVLGVEPIGLRSALTEWSGTMKPEGLHFEKLTEDLVDRMVEWELESVRNDANLMPDLVADGHGLERLGQVAQACDRAIPARRVRDEVKKLTKERDAQLAWHEMLKAGFPPTKEAIAAYRKAHPGTRWAEAMVRGFD